MSGRAGRGRQADAGTGAGARRWDARGAGTRGALGRAAAGGSWARRRAAGARQARWARGLCAQAGPAGPGWSFIHSDSVFGPGSTRYFFLSH